MHKGFWAVGAVLIAGAAVAALKMTPGEDDRPLVVNVNVPELSLTARRGQALFQETCAICHGENAGGSHQGPPLIHPIYHPSHHADGAFQVAVKTGVRQHHWPYGNMPRQDQVTPAQVDAIVVYIRELQAANGILDR